MKLPKELEQRRDELDRKYLNDPANYYPLIKGHYDGFNACWEELAPVVEALKEMEPILYKLRDNFDSEKNSMRQATRVLELTGIVRQALAKLGLK